VTVTAVPLVSASALKRCGWARVLEKRRPKNAKAEVAKGKGHDFHGIVDEYVKTGQLKDAGSDEINGWVDNLMHRWRPKPGTLTEVALGLGPGPCYVEVCEPLPHVYAPTPEAGGLATPLLTAGRADIVTPGACLEVLDWKTGIYEPEDPNTNLQLWALGLAAGLRWHAHEVRVGLYMVQDCRFVWSDPVVVGSQEWQLRVTDVEEAATVGEKPVPGANCLSCWQRRNCEFAVDAA